MDDLKAAIHTAIERRFGDGDYLQRPRFLAIREFGPGALIYHEGARYQVDRIQLPLGGAGDLVTSSAKQCDGCGYLGVVTEDRCDMCGASLPTATTGLLQLHTVFTKRRERISSDEEEVVELCDLALVFASGRVVASLERAQLNERDLVMAATGSGADFDRGGPDDD